MRRFMNSSALVCSMLISLCLLRLALPDADFAAYCADDPADPGAVRYGRVTCDALVAATKGRKQDIVAFGAEVRARCIDGGLVARREMRGPGGCIRPVGLAGRKFQSQVQRQ